MKALSASPGMTEVRLARHEGRAILKMRSWMLPIAACSLIMSRRSLLSNRPNI